ncbi:MAG: DUF5977 domain-containing protein [Agriterribacter sp.]
MRSFAIIFACWLILFFPFVGIAQVNLQTGASEASFPLYQFGDAKTGLSTSVTLTYVSGNGLKVNSMASSVGTGWELAAAGTIVRIQNGEPDDQKFTAPTSGPFSGVDPSETVVTGVSYIDDFYPNGYLYTNISPTTAVPGNAAFYPMFPSGVYSQYKPNFVDREQDVFVAQFNGRTSRFVIGKDLSVLNIEDSNLKIEFVQTDMTAQSIRTRISAFTIIDENGMKYVFSEKELAENLMPGGLSNGLPTGKDMSTPMPVKVVTKWLLKEIINPLINKKITFNYEAYAVDIPGPKSVSYQRSNQDGSTPSNPKYVLRIKSDLKRLANIALPDGQQVNFVYSTIPRTDFPGDKALEKINVSYNNAFKYGYQFTYGYLFKKEIKAFNYNFGSDEKRFARLCLLSFAKTGLQNNQLPPHSFEYHMYVEGFGASSDFQTVPAMYSNSTDFWGYYNAKTNLDDASGNPSSELNGVITNQKFPYSAFAQIGILKKITYPEGGSLEYTYRERRSTASNIWSDGTQGLAGGVHVTSTRYSDGVSVNNDIIKEYKYINTDGKSSMWGWEMPVNKQQKTVRLYKNNSQLFGGVFAKEGVTGFIANIAYSSLQSYLYSGAVNPWAAVVMFVVSTIIYEYFTPEYKDYTVTTYLSENLLNKNPLPLQYRRVEVIEKMGTSNNGKTVYEFTSNVEYPITGTYGFPYSAKPRCATWLYGLPKTIEWYNAAGTRLRKIENNYTARVITVDWNAFSSNGWQANGSYMAKYDRQSEFITQTGFVSNDVYYPTIGHIQLDETLETNYNDAGEAVVTSTKYTYTNYFKIRTVEKTNSLGGTDGTTFFYPQDYTSSSDEPFVIAMKNNNWFVPIVTTTWFKKTPTDSKSTSRSLLTFYSTISNGDLKPYYVLQYDPVTPGSNYADGKPTLSTYVSDRFRGWTYKMYFYYDSYGNLVNTKSLGNKYASKLFDYDNNLVIAEVVNAPNDQVAYTSFEAEGKGNWTFSGTPDNDVTAITGKKTYDLSKGGLTKSVTSGTTYTVSYWRPSSQSSLSIAGTQSGYPVNSPVVNGWIFYEHKVTGVSTITLSGTGLIDEVKLFPVDAAMRTYTWDPLVGVSSECGIDNQFTYTEYDNFNRPIHIKDQDKNILKKICYNYAGQPEGCIQYVSEDKSGYYTRNNCAPGYIGSNVYVSIPKGRFTSFLSQADADLQATNFGKAQANVTGVCNASVKLKLNFTNSYSSSSPPSVYVILTNVETNASFYFYYDPVPYQGGYYSTTEVVTPPGRYTIDIYSSDFSVEVATPYNVVSPSYSDRLHMRFENVDLTTVDETELYYRTTGY